MSASISVLPVEYQEPNCLDCQHAMMGPPGAFCYLYREDIIDTSIAEECEEFDPQ